MWVEHDVELYLGYVGGTISFWLQQHLAGFAAKKDA
jgi:hypothetical protein